MRRLIALSMAFALATSAVPCAITAEEGAKVWLSGEAAIIVWDSARQTQHFIREATFDADRPQFGFVVPTPEVPQLAEVDPAAFGQLEMMALRSLYEETASTSIDVLVTQKVGNYTATVVRASSADDLMPWLAKNGFAMRAALRGWLDHYIQRGWVFTAFRYNQPQSGEKPTQAVRLSFKTTEPYYPYRMPSDTLASGPLTMFFISIGRVAPRYEEGGKTWEARRVATFELGEHGSQELARYLKLSPADLPPTMMVTKWERPKNDRRLASDLRFTTAPPDVAGWIAGGAGAGLAAAVLRRGRRAANPDLSSSSVT